MEEGRVKSLIYSKIRVSALAAGTGIRAERRNCDKKYAGIFNHMNLQRTPKHLYHLLPSNWTRSHNDSLNDA